MLDPKPATVPAIREQATTAGSYDAWFTPGRFAAFLGLFLCATFFAALTGQETFFYRDFGLFSYPVAHYQRECFWRGEIPLWNPFNYCGIPFLAQWNTMALYPLSLFYLVFPLSWSLGVFNVAHLFLGGMGMYFLAYRWTGNRLGACVAGTAYSCNGLMWHALMWSSNIAALGWMPWVVLAVESTWQQGGRRKIVLAALAGAMQMLSGAPEPIILTWFVLGALWLAQMFRDNFSRRQIFSRFFIVICLVAGLSAAQLLPFLELLAHSQRDAGFGDSRWAMPLWGWANFFVPLFHCSPSIIGVFSQNVQQWTASYYMGIGLLALAIMAVWQTRHPRVYLLSAIALTGLVLSMGENARLLSWIKQAFPLVGIMRYPIKIVILPVFALPLLAAFAIKKCPGMTPPDARKVQHRSIALGIILLLALGGILVYARQFPFTDDSWPVTVESGLTRAVFLVLTLGVFCLLTKTWPGRTLGMVGVTLVLLIALDTLTHAPKQNPTISVRAYETLGIEQSVKARHGESRALVNPKLQAFLSRAATTNTFNYYTGFRRALYMDCNLIDHIPTAGGFFSIYLRSSAKVSALLNDAPNGLPEPLADFIGASQISAPDTSFTWLDRTNFMPLATAGQKPVFAGPDETLKAISSPGFDPRSTVFLPLNARASITVSNQSAPRIISRKFFAQEALLEIQADEPALVVVAQSFYNPWHAYVDGRLVPLWEANYAFQALEAPAGHHKVELVYEDRMFKVGAAISLITLLIAGLGWFWRPHV